MVARSCVLLALGSSVALAAPLKVDINNTGRPLTEGLDPDFTPWTSDTTVFPSSATFSGVTITFARAGSVGTGLQTGYWKEGVQSTSYNVKLTGDGLKVADGEAGGQIEMRIAGLSAGAHTLLLHLNSWDGVTSIAPVDILVNGTQVVNNLAVSVRVTDNNLATTAYLNLTAVSGQDVVVLIKADTAGSQTSKNVHLNGFEIDTPNAKAQANNPVPANADEHVNADTGSATLSWGTAVLGAASHNVYFGTSLSAVTNATTASAEYKGNRTTNTYALTGLSPHLTYYWRVDEVASGGGITKGDTWMFRARRLAFPGAEGYGRFARGGRGGAVVKVTNLNDSGAGSLRDAIENVSGPRTIVFDVGGLITLNDDIIIDGTMPGITIAGQTAPGKGICIKRQQFAMSGARDVVFRYMRLLVGKESGETQNATGMAGVDHCIMDHVSAGWGIDEGLSTRGGKNLTFQRNSLSEALNVAGHQNYPAGTAHGYAASIGGDTGSFHHNLLAHNEGRNWSMAGGLDGAGYYAGKLDIFNNLVYNYGGRTTDGGAHEVNFVNNYYKRGPANGITTLLNPAYGGFPGTQQYYMVGNVLLNGSTTVTDQAALLSVGTESGGVLPQNSTPPYSATVSSAFFPSYATIHTARNAFKQVLSDSGCNLPQMDNRDIRIVNETLNGTYTYTGSVSGKKGLPDTTADVGGWETYATTTRAAGFDSDNDGMPDWWETIKGTSNSSPAGNFTESNSDADGDGYTALEEYLNWMAAPNFQVNAGASVDVDLHALARGYLATTPTFTLASPTNGTVSLVSSRYARFTPSTSANALGKFTFTVTDPAGDTMTRTVNVRIVGATTPPAAPTGLSATAGNAQVSLAWTASSGATSYNVKRSTTSGSGYATVGTATGTSFTNTGLTNGTTYYYVVSAVNANGESANSSQASATPQPAAPAAPTGLSATAGNAQVSLTWSASSGATSYNVKRSTTSGSGYATVGTATSTSFTNTGLTNGTTYYFVVTTVNAGGESANSAQASATPQIPAPAAPTGLGATSGNAQASLTWSASSGATSYNIKRSTTSGSGYATVGTATSTSFTNTGLTNGTTYYYVVSAVNGGGESANSSQASATPQIPAPAAPTGLSATAGNAQVSLSWTASSGATSYNIKRSTTSGSGYSTVGSATGTSFTNTGLTNGTTYYYVVSAVNAGGESANSSQASATPVAPTASLFTYEGFTYATNTNLSAQNGGSGWGLPWSNAAINNATATAAGLVYGNLTSSGGAAQFGPNSTSTVVFTRQFSNTLGNLAGGGAGSVWMSFLYLNNGSSTVEARIGFYGGMVADANGYTNTSSSGLPHPVDVGRPPTSAASADQIHLYNGTTVVSSGVATPRASSPAFLLLKFNLSGSSSTADSLQLWVNPNLANGEAGLGTAQATWSTSVDLEIINGIRFQNAATGSVLIDELRLGSAFSAVTTQLAAPAGLSATPANAQVALTWNAVSGASSYSVYRSTTSGGPYTAVGTVSTTSYTNTGLTNGTTYYYVVSAMNSNGEGADSTQVSATPSSGGSGIPAVTIQAESATISGGTFDSNNAGFNGTAFANLNASAGSLQFSGISGGSTGGAATLTIRFALGATASRTGNLVINGVTQSITFPITGAWTTWTTMNVPITLASGTANTIRFETTGNDLANIDEISTAP